MQDLFDNPPSRVGTNDAKYTFRPYQINEDVPIRAHSIADMDFPTSPKILEAVRNVCCNGIIGYSFQPKDIHQIIQKYLSSHGWDISDERIKQAVCFSGSVISGIGVVLHTLTNPGDGVMIQTPIYPHFFQSIEETDRVVVVNPMKETENGWAVDYEDFENKIIQQNVKAFLLCSPHNPTGRVFSTEELTQMVTICKKHNVLIISDEIHCDLLMEDVKHTHLSSMPIAKDCSVTLLAASKSFNVPGLHLAMIVGENEEYMKKIKKFSDGVGLSHGNAFGFSGMKVAYSGEANDWLETCLNYLRGNVEYVVNYLHINLPTIKVRKPQATYLLWMDFSGYNLESDVMCKMLGEKGIILSAGPSFGKGYEKCFRFNYASSRKEIEEVMELIKEIFIKYEK
ncbi:cysteine-S-conjugate beta-lyase [Entamoeba marina]